MNYHKIVASALQKYYSALKSLDEFGERGDFFDDVSNLDKFFSEYRNITFAIQKGLETDANKEIYTKLRQEHLSGTTSKWFIETRNKVTKEGPFNLRKELCVDVYLPGGMITLKDTRLVVNVDSSFSDALAYIRKVFFEELKLVEIFFTSRILFKEADTELDLYPAIMSGILQMDKFTKELSEHFRCDCDYCNELRQKIKKLSSKIRSKEITFTQDYSLEVGKKPVVGDKVELYMSKDGIEYSRQADLRLSLNNPVYGEAKEDLDLLFLKFVSMHTVIFQMQEHQILPTFMLIYNNETYRMLSFAASSKASFYRTVMEIISLSDFHEIEAIFYCGEYYSYDLEQFSAISDKPYSERKSMAQKEILGFTMLTREAADRSICLDESQIDNMEYVTAQFRKFRQSEKQEDDPFDWLMPIKEKLIEKKPH